MLALLSALALGAAPASPPTPPIVLIAPPTPVLTSDQQVAMDCAVAFGLLAGNQREGRPGASRWPAMGPRHREFFVRVSAKLIDDYGIGRMQITNLARASARRFAADPEKLDAAMPGCLALLEASGQ